MKYFELENDRFIESRWFLSDLLDSTDTELDSREFTYGNRIDPGPPLKCYMWNEDTIVDIHPPLRWVWSREGTPLDFTYSDEGAPIVTKEVARLLSKIADKDIQRFSVKVDRMEKDYEMINVIALADCIDTKRSEILWWEEGNDIRPDKAGKPHSISKLVIDPDRVNNHHIFRLQEWTLPVIVSDVVKEALEEANVTGVVFRQV